MSEPQWSVCRPDADSKKTPADGTTRSGQHDGLIVGVGLVVVGLVIAVLVATGGERSGDGAGGEMDTIDVTALESDVLADALAEAGKLEEGDPYEVRISEALLWVTYYDTGPGERRHLTIDLDATMDHRIRTDADVESGFDPTTFSLDDVDVEVLGDLTEQAMAETEEPTDFTIHIEVPDRAEDALIDILVHDPDDSAWLTAQLDGSDVDIA